MIEKFQDFYLQQNSYIRLLICFFIVSIPSYLILDPIVIEKEGQIKLLKKTLNIEQKIYAQRLFHKNNLKSKTSDELSKVTGGFGIPGFKWPL